MHFPVSTLHLFGLGTEPRKSQNLEKMEPTLQTLPRDVQRIVFSYLTEWRDFRAINVLWKGSRELAQSAAEVVTAGGLIGQNLLGCDRSYLCWLRSAKNVRRIRLESLDSLVDPRMVLPLSDHPRLEYIDLGRRRDILYTFLYRYLEKRNLQRCRTLSFAVEGLTFEDQRVVMDSACQHICSYLPLLDVRHVQANLDSVRLDNLLWLMVRPYSCSFEFRGDPGKLFDLFGRLTRMTVKARIVGLHSPLLQPFDRELGCVPDAYAATITSLQVCVSCKRLDELAKKYRNAHAFYILLLSTNLSADVTALERFLSINPAKRVVLCLSESDELGFMLGREDLYARCHQIRTGSPLLSWEQCRPLF